MIRRSGLGSNEPLVDIENYINVDQGQVCTQPFPSSVKGLMTRSLASCVAIVFVSKSPLFLLPNKITLAHVDNFERMQEAILSAYRSYEEGFSQIFFIGRRQGFRTLSVGEEDRLAWEEAQEGEFIFPELFDDVLYQNQLISSIIHLLGLKEQQYKILETTTGDFLIHSNGVYQLNFNQDLAETSMDSQIAPIFPPLSFGSSNSSGY